MSFSPSFGGGRGGYLFLPLRRSVGSLLAILCFLLGRTGAVGAGDVFLLFGFCLHLIIVLLGFGGTLETDAIDKDILKVIHRLEINGGTI